MDNIPYPCEPVNRGGLCSRGSAKSSSMPFLKGTLPLFTIVYFFLEVQLTGGSFLDCKLVTVFSSRMRGSDEPAEANQSAEAGLEAAASDDDVSISITAHMTEHMFESSFLPPRLPSFLLSFLPSFLEITAQLHR